MVLILDSKGSRQKIKFFLSGPAKKGGGRKGLATMKKKLFLKLEKKKFPPKNLATKLERGGDKALVSGPLKKEPFFAASLRKDTQVYNLHI